MAKYQATCSKCGWTGGYYTNTRDRDNAVQLHQNTGCTNKGGSAKADDGWYTASCHCGFTTNRYGTQKAADAALARHKQHLNH